MNFNIRPQIFFRSTVAAQPASNSSVTPTIPDQASNPEINGQIEGPKIKGQSTADTFETVKDSSASSDIPKPDKIDTFQPQNASPVSTELPGKMSGPKISDQKPDNKTMLDAPESPKAPRKMTKKQKKELKKIAEGKELPALTLDVKDAIMKSNSIDNEVKKKIAETPLDNPDAFNETMKKIFEENDDKL